MLSSNFDPYPINLTNSDIGIKYMKSTLSIPSLDRLFGLEKEYMGFFVILLLLCVFFPRSFAQSVLANSG